MTARSERQNGRRDTTIVALGLSHKRVPIALRERLAFPRCDLGSSLQELKRFVGEGAILSTCNRVEVYAVGVDSGEVADRLKRFWSERRRVPIHEFEPYLERLEGREAVEHLFAVACGLDSAIIGEPQILGQVREAMRQALEQGAMGHVLSALFRAAITTGKRARTETGIGRNAATISSAAVDLAYRTLGDLSVARVLLVGAGKMGELAARNLLDKGAAEIAVVGRRLERAEQLALRCGSVIALNRLEEALRDCDIAITCTSAPHHVIHHQTLARVMSERPERRLVLIDIAVPRDVEPDCGEIPGVDVYNIDDLESTVASNVEERQAEACKVMPIVEEEVRSFQRWQATLRVVPTIVALRRRAEAIRQEELSRTAGVLSRLPSRDRERIEALTVAMQKKLLHNAIALMRRNAADGDGIETAAAVRELFGLDGDADASV